MAKIKKDEEVAKVLVPGDYGYKYNLRDPDARYVVEQFGKELAKFDGPYAFELYCVAKGYLLGCEIKQCKVDVDGKTIEFEMPINGRINGAKLDFLKVDEQKYSALTALLAWRARIASKQQSMSL